MSNNINRLRMQLDAAIAQAVAIQNRLSVARENAGLPNPQAIYTAAEFDELRAEHSKELKAITRAILSPSPAFSRIAKLATTVNDSTRKQQQLNSQKSMTAADIIAAGKKRRGEAQ